MRRRDGVACCCLGTAATRSLHRTNRQFEAAHRMVNQDQDLSRRMDIQQCLQYDAGVSLSIRTLCSDYRMSHFPDASGPIEYIADYRSETTACERMDGYPRYTGDVNVRLVGLGRDLIVCSISRANIRLKRSHRLVEKHCTDYNRQSLYGIKVATYLLHNSSAQLQSLLPMYNSLSARRPLSDLVTGILL